MLRNGDSRVFHSRPGPRPAVHRPGRGRTHRYRHVTARPAQPNEPVRSIVIARKAERAEGFHSTLQLLSRQGPIVDLRGTRAGAEKRLATVHFT